MNILYVVGSLSIVEPLGVMQISAMTRLQGHTSVLGVIAQDDLAEMIAKEHIDLVALSLLSTEAKEFLWAAQAIKARFPYLPVIAGGPHPTYFPQMIDSWPLDAIVIGEGDDVIGQLVEALARGDDFSHIPNVWTKTQKNSLTLLIAELDKLPFVDRELVRHRVPLRYIPMKSFMATRGCPYRCAYCFNDAYWRLYHGLGAMVRRRSVSHLIAEIKAVKSQAPLSFIRFGDDVFVAKHDEWLEEFVEQYAAQIGLPFYCLVRPNLVTQDIVGALKKAGCHSVAISLETGNEALRKTVLNRAISDEMILRAYTILREHDIRIFSNCMLGLPESNLADDLQSLAMSFQCRPTYASFTVFTPFPGTELYRWCLAKEYIQESFEDGAYPESTFQSSCLKTVSEQDKNVHQNILMLGALANWQPVFRNLIVNRLLYWKPNTLFALIGFVVRNYLQRKIWPFKLTPFSFLRLAVNVFLLDKKNYARRGIEH